MRRLLILVLVTLGACDPCDVAAQIHLDRCTAGDPVSCEWLAEHAPSGYCVG